MNYYEIAMQISQWTQQVVNHAMPCHAMWCIVVAVFVLFPFYQPIPPIRFDIFVIVINSVNAESMCLSKNNNKYSDNIHKYPSRPDSTYLLLQSNEQNSPAPPPSSSFSIEHTSSKRLFLYFDYFVCNFFMPSLWIHFN